MKRAATSVLVHAATAGIAVLFLGLTLRPSAWRSLPDFDKAYYAAGQKVLRAPETLYEATPVDFVNVPIVALLFVPFASLDPETARLAFTLLGDVALLATGALLVRFAALEGWRRVLAFVLVLVNGPLHYSLGLGNATHVVLPVLLLVVAASRAGGDAAAGALLAVAAVVKIPLFVLAAPFALRGRWRALLAFGATLAAIAGASLLLFGPELHRVWFDRCIRPFAAGPLGAYNVQSVDGFLARLLAGAGRHDWDPVSVGLKFLAVRYALLALLVGGTLAVSLRAGPPRRPESDTLELATFLTLALLVTPISWTHYYLFLLVPFAYLAGGGLDVPRGRGWLAGLGVGAALVSLPVVEAAGRVGPVLRFVLTRTAHSPYFFGGIVLLGVFLAARWRGRRA